MMRHLLSLLLAALCLSAALSAHNYPDYADFRGQPFTVTYNARAVLLNENPSLFLSGSIHYPRFTPGMWLPMLKQAKEDGLNLVQIYVFWNGHEPIEGQITWEDRYNLNGFLAAVAEAGLFANLRIGPYVCAEWDLGGIPTWLQFNRPGIRYRSFESQWRQAMQQWFGTVVNQTRSYFADHGGPIILVQVENELNGADERYVQWCGDMAASFNLNVPITMCNGQSANGTDVAIHPRRESKEISDEIYLGKGAVTINTCNANDCTGFLSSHGQNHRILLDQPAIWTENEMWFTSWFESTNPLSEGDNRTSQDVGFVVMRFIARGGSISNDYMYFGGNNYGSTAGGGVATMYANGAHHHSDGLPNEPRYTNMNIMYHLLPKIAEDLATNPAALDRAITLQWRASPSNPWADGTQQLAFEYGKNLAFVESSAPVWVQTQYNGVVYDMAPNSIIVLVGGRITWNSSEAVEVKSHRAYEPAVTSSSLKWQAWTEPVFPKQSVNADMPVFVADRPLEQLNLTRSLTEFMWYSTVVNIAQDGTDVPFTVDGGTGEAFQLFVDGQSVSNVWDASHSWTTNMVQMKGKISNLAKGKHVVSILSTAIGNQNGMNADEDPVINHQQGINIGGNFTIGNQDFTHQSWSHRPYLVGQYLDIAGPSGQGSVPWTDASSALSTPITWFTATFAPFELPKEHKFSILLDINGLGRGKAYINGNDIGRYWSCLGGDKQMTQRYYHIPQDWLNWGTNAVNTITLFEELGAASLGNVQIVTSHIVYGSWGDNKQTLTASE